VSRQSRLVPRHPLAFGMTWWGPLPGTERAAIMWGGPGDNLLYFPAGLDSATAPWIPVRHPAASGTYQTVAEAEKAVNAFVAAGLAAQAEEGD
jgi:hypothetical protein